MGLMAFASQAGQLVTWAFSTAPRERCARGAVTTHISTVFVHGGPKSEENAHA